MNAPTLIGLCGYARTGKDTVGAELVKLGYERRAFADKLRELALACDPLLDFYEGMDPESGEDVRYSDAMIDLGYEQAKNQYPEVRDFLVRLGAGARKVLGGNVWLNACLPADPENHTVVTDCRYLNEVQRVLDLGGSVWMVTRPDVGPANDEEKHSFDEIVEAKLPGLVTFFNNGDLDQIGLRVQATLSAIS